MIPFLRAPPERVWLVALVLLLSIVVELLSFQLDRLATSPILKVEDFALLVGCSPDAGEPQSERSRQPAALAAGHRSDTQRHSAAVEPTVDAGFRTALCSRQLRRGPLDLVDSGSDAHRRLCRLGLAPVWGRAGETLDSLADGLHILPGVAVLLGLGQLEHHRPGWTAGFSALRASRAGFPRRDFRRPGSDEAAGSPSVLDRAAGLLGRPTALGRAAVPR